jgi:hypothetical protein
MQDDIDYVIAFYFFFVTNMLPHAINHIIPNPRRQRHPFVLPINIRVIEHKGMDLYGMCFVMLLHRPDLLYFSVTASV